MVKIAIDARPLTNPTDGIGRYTAQIVNRLIDSGGRDDAPQIYLYAHKPLVSPLAIDCKVRIAPRWLQQSQLASQVLFPRWAQQDRINVFWSPRHHLPLMLQCPAMVTIHDLCWKVVPQTMPRTRRLTERLLFPAAIDKAARVAVVSANTRADLLRWFPQAAPAVRLIGPGVSAMPAAHAHDWIERPYLLCVGTLEPRKNHAMLIQAFAAVRDAIQHNLLLVGRQGWHGVDVASMIAEHGLQDRVQWIAQLDDQGLADCYAGADALVTASTYEGFNLPILEAMSAGVPVIASDIAVHREVAGDAAVYFRAHPETLADTLVSLLQDDARLASLRAQTGVQAAKYDWRESAAKTLTNLLEIAG